MDDEKPYRMATQVAEVLYEKEGAYAWLYALEQMADINNPSLETYKMWKSVLTELDKLKEKHHVAVY